MKYSATKSVMSSAKKSAMGVVAGLLALLVPMTASAQTVFFDDFEGNTLLPHWTQPPASYWEYNVSNSRLNVTALLNPSNPHAPSNIAIMGAPYAPQTDFRIDVRMGWEQGTAPQELLFYVVGVQGELMASFGYSNEPGPFPNGIIFGGASGQGVRVSAPPPGMYDFTITRVAMEFQFYVEGNLFATFTDTFGTQAAGISLFFLGPFPGQLGTLSVDRVQIVPAPTGFLVPVVLLLGHARRKRRAPLISMRDLSFVTIPSSRRQP